MQLLLNTTHVHQGKMQQQRPNLVLCTRNCLKHDMSIVMPEMITYYAVMNTQIVCPAIIADM